MLTDDLEAPKSILDAYKYLLSVPGTGNGWETLLRYWASIEKKLNYPDGKV